LKKTRKILKDVYGNKKFISDEEYQAIRFIDNGGIPNSKLKKKEYKYASKEYKRHLIILISWLIRKKSRLKKIIANKLKVKINNINKKLIKINWKKLEKIYKICLDYSKNKKTRKILLK
jgi:hypothetical protein